MCEYVARVFCSCRKRGGSPAVADEASRPRTKQTSCMFGRAVLVSMLNNYRSDDVREPS